MLLTSIRIDDGVQERCAAVMQAGLRANTRGRPGWQRKPGENREAAARVGPAAGGAAGDITASCVVRQQQRGHARRALDAGSFWESVGTKGRHWLEVAAPVGKSIARLTPPWRAWQRVRSASRRDPGRQLARRTLAPARLSRSRTASLQARMCSCLLVLPLAPKP